MSVLPLYSFVLYLDPLAVMPSEKLIVEGQLGRLTEEQIEEGN